MTSVCFYFQVHQPFRLKPYSFFQMGNDHLYEYEKQNKEILDKVSEKCYLPTNLLMLDLIKKHKGKFRISYSISGVALEQFEKYRPDVLQTFKDLVKTGCVEILAETYYHSLAFTYSKEEFEEQVKLHSDKVFGLFGVKPTVFRNTELIFNNELAQHIHKLGFKGVVTEGVDRLLGSRSPNYVYQSVSSPIALLLKNYKLSDDIAFRFSNKEWEEYPLYANKFAYWTHSAAGRGETINLFMDYETFGEHQWADSGIFDFMRCLPDAILKHPHFDFKTPSEVIATYPKRELYDAHQFISWADSERDLSAWLDNSIQKAAVQRISSLGDRVKLVENPALLHQWRKLQTSDHFYYMSTKYWSDGDVHKYFSPYDSPLQAYANYMNVLVDFEHVLEMEEDNALHNLTTKELTETINQIL